jgi:hypothetical protein
MEFLIDELYLRLSLLPQYQQQAARLLRLIPLCLGELPKFTIAAKDLGEYLEDKLYQQSIAARKYVLSEVLTRLLEDSDLYYYAMSVKRYRKYFRVELTA